MKLPFLFKINLATLVVCFCESALTPEIRKAYDGLLKGEGLFVAEDDIVILNATNYKSTLYGTQNSWLVNFYNSWCGHCYKFAPVWKALAADMHEWKSVIQLAAIDCAHENHTSVCRDFDIMEYPSIKFFSAYSPQSYLGTKIARTSQSIRHIVKDVVEILKNEQLEGRGSQWPNIIPYRSFDLSNLWNQLKKVNYLFLIFADSNDSFATEVILDFSNAKGIEVRSVVPENEVLTKSLGVLSFPSLIVLEKEHEPQFLHPRDFERQSIKKTIKEFLQKKGITLPEEKKNDQLPSPDERPNFSDLQEARNELIRLWKIKEIGDVVFLIDLENTLRYSLEHEIASKKQITGQQFKALTKFLGVVSKYFPLSETGAEYLKNLSQAVLIKNEINGLTFKMYLNNYSRSGFDSVFLTNEKQWMGCRGSYSNFRRYPCGMWTLFHYMTVNALQDSNHPDFDSLEVLDAMLGYITHFFGCSSCSKHFQEMAHNKSMTTKVTTGEEAVLWLWSAHNEVNDRLAKEKSEDPEFPKIQYPSAERCSNCRHSNGDWNEQNVLHYLVSVYGKNNLNQMGSKAKLYFPNKPVFELNKHVKSEQLEDGNSKNFIKYFNVFDISLCVLIYIISTIICIGVCFKFILKKRHRKKNYVQDLFGKV